MGNPELLNSWTPYVYISMVLYGWLVTAAALHIPVNSLGQLGSTIKQPVRAWAPFDRPGPVLICGYVYTSRSRCSSRSSR